MVDVEIAKLERHDTAVIRIQVRPEEMPTVMGPAISELYEQCGKQGVQPEGGPFSRYYSLAETWDFEVGVPVARRVTAAGRVQPGELPACEAAVAWHIGPYERLAETHAEVDQWLTARGRATAGPFWEVYHSDPMAEPDPEKWRTELVRPLAPAG